MNLLQRRTAVPIIGLTLALVSPASARDNSALKESLAYLRDIEEVAWVELRGFQAKYSPRRSQDPRCKRTESNPKHCLPQCPASNNVGR